MDNAELIGNMQVNALELWLKLYDNKTKTGTFEGKEVSKLVQSLEANGFIRPFGKDKEKQIWECVTAQFTTEDLGMIRRIVNAKKEPSYIPFHDLVPELDNQESERLKIYFEKNKIARQEVEVNPEIDSKLLELGFITADGENYRLNPKLMYDDYEFNLYQRVLDQINMRNEQKAARDLMAERTA